MILLVVPVSERKGILHAFHLLRHLFFYKTYLAIFRVYLWYQMYNNLKIFIKTCPDCQTSKSYHKYKVFLKPLVIRLGFGNTLYLDYSGPYPDSGKGERHICAIVDCYSSYCWLFPTADMTNGSAVRCLLHVVSQIGAFQNLISDRASAFLEVVMTSFLELFDITKISTSSYSPRSKSKVERLQKTSIECLLVGEVHFGVSRVQGGLHGVTLCVCGINFCLGRVEGCVMDLDHSFLLVDLHSQCSEYFELGCPGVMAMFTPGAPARRRRCDSVEIRNTSFKISFYFDTYWVEVYTGNKYKGCKPNKL